MDSMHRTDSVATITPPEDRTALRGPDPARELHWKHRIDRLAAAFLIVLLSPLLLAVALAVKVATGGPVLVRERRLTRQGGSFEMLGFSPVAFLRRWPVDQLPQLFNVLKGEMSFVGPRPERPEFVEIFGENLRRYEQPRRVKPGITGWAQVRALEGHAPLAERVRWDEVYVESWSLGLDAKIIAMTLWRVLREPPEAS
jgi:lipopolysaccharide/colanic/teichoic acid biosynthesis glycosyltransferase